MPPENPDSDFFLIAGNRLGNDSNVNWSINRYGVTPEAGDAFHNLHERGLIMYSKGSFGKKRKRKKDQKKKMKTKMFKKKKNTEKKN